MRRIILVILVSIGVFCLTYCSNKQLERYKEQKNSVLKSLEIGMDSVKMLYNLCEIRLDSVMLVNAKYAEKLNKVQNDINFLKTEINKLLTNTASNESELYNAKDLDKIKERLEKASSSEADLRRAKELIVQLNDKISSIEIEKISDTRSEQSTTTPLTSLQQAKKDLEQSLESADKKKNNPDKKQ